MSGSPYVIVGAGVVGLYTAFLLVHYGHVPGSSITIVAQFLPGDESIYYALPTAGANFSCILPDLPQALRFDKATYTHLRELQQAVGQEMGADIGLARYLLTEYWDAPPLPAKLALLRLYLEEMQDVPAEELPAGAVRGIRYRTWNFFSPKFIATLLQYLQRRGVRVERARLDHIRDVQAFAPLVVFNCTGLGARWLGGIEDERAYAARGQVVVIRTAKTLTENRMRWAADGGATYIIPRPGLNNQVVLGGFLHNHRFDPNTYKLETEDIMHRVEGLFPELLTEYGGATGWDIVRTAAGWRPAREGGTRIETDTASVPGVTVVHNYGAGGYGFQAGLGMALEAVELVLPRLAASL